MTVSKPVTLDDALMWLNDRLGEMVAAEIHCVRSGFDFSILEAEGTLSHGTERFGPHRDQASRDSNRGLYRIGREASGSILHLRDELVPGQIACEPHLLTVRLDECTWLEVVEDPGLEELE